MTKAIQDSILRLELSGINVSNITDKYISHFWHAYQTTASQQLSYT